MGVPIERPGKIIAVGLNYRDHVAEGDRPAPTRPLLFAKWQSSLIGPDEPIVLPSISDSVDFEGELGLVIGERVKRVSRENALEAVRGYIVVNDVSARDIQREDGQFTRAKSLDTFCPVGPRLVGAAQFVPQRQRPLRIRVDQQTRLRRLDLRSEMSGEGTLARASLTRCKNNNVHTSASRLTQGARVNQVPDSWKENLETFEA